MEDMPLLENKYSTKDVEKVTYELADMKQSVTTISSMGLNEFYGQSKGSTGFLILIVGF